MKPVEPRRGVCQHTGAPSCEKPARWSIKNVGRFCTEHVGQHLPLVPCEVVPVELDPE